MTDYVKSLKVNSVSHPVLGAALENPNTSAGAVKDLKVWQGTAAEFTAQPCPLYKWTRAGSRIELSRSSSAISLYNPLVSYNCGSYTIISDNRADLIKVNPDMSIEKLTNPSGNYGYSPVIWTGTKMLYGPTTTTAAIKESTDGITWTDTSYVPGFSVRSSIVLGDKIIMSSRTTSPQAYVYSSDGGTTWTSSSISVSNAYVYVCDDLAYTYGSGNTMVSTDGINWTDTQQTTLIVDCKYNGAYYGHIASTTTIMASEDGITWTAEASTLPSTAPVFPCFTNSEGTWFFIKSNQAYTSTDRSTWSPVDVGLTDPSYTNYAWCLNFDGNTAAIFNTAGSASTRYLMSIFNITTNVYTKAYPAQVGDSVRYKYTPIPEKITAATVNTITVQGVTFNMAVPGFLPSAKVPYNFINESAICDVKDVGIFEGTDQPALKKLLTDTDVSSIITSGALCGVAIPDKMQLLTTTGLKEFNRYSEFSVGWTTTSTRAYTSGNFNLFYLNGKYFAAPNTVAVGSAVLYSTDANTWNATNMTTTYIGDIAYGNGKYIGITENSTIKKSTDGITWTSELVASASKVLFGNNVFMLCSSTSYKYSTDNGDTWTTGTLPATFNSIYTWAFVDGYFYLWGYSNPNYVAYRSSDGINWTALTIGTSYNFNNVVKFKNKYYAASSGTRPWSTSTDGLTWTDMDFPLGIQFNNAYTDGNVMIATYQYNTLIPTTIAYTRDGTNWYLSKFSNIGQYRFVYGNNEFVGLHNYMQDTVKSTSSNSFTDINYNVVSDGKDNTTTQVYSNLNGTIKWNNFTIPAYNSATETLTI